LARLVFVAGEVWVWDTQFPAPDAIPRWNWTMDSDWDKDPRLAFEEGVVAALNQWQALTMAVQEEWGGSHSKDKRRRLEDDILSLFANKPREHYTTLLHALMPWYVEDGVG
jgi:hypothetical protein